jgi:hypothetical protein
MPRVPSTANVFLNSELQTKTFASKPSVTSGMQWEGHGHETAGLFCTAPHLHIGRWWSKGLRKGKVTSLGIRHVPLTYHSPTFFSFRC